jgi:hypothetical protein
LYRYDEHLLIRPPLGDFGALPATPPPHTAAEQTKKTERYGGEHDAVRISR